MLDRATVTESLGLWLKTAEPATLRRVFGVPALQNATALLLEEKRLPGITEASVETVECAKWAASILIARYSAWLHEHGHAMPQVELSADVSDQHPARFAVTFTAKLSSGERATCRYVWAEDVVYLPNGHVEMVTTERHAYSIVFHFFKDRGVQTY